MDKKKINSFVKNATLRLKKDDSNRPKVQPKIKELNTFGLGSSIPENEASQPALSARSFSAKENRMSMLFNTTSGRHDEDRKEKRKTHRIEFAPDTFDKPIAEVATPEEPVIQEVTPEMIELQFIAVARELGIPENSVTSLDKKWQIITQSAALRGLQASTEADDLDEVLRTLSKTKKLIKTDYLKKVRVILQTRPMSWVRRFMDSNGFELILSAFRECLQHTSEPNSKDVILECVRCLKATLTMDKSIFERVLEVSDVFVLIGRGVDGLPPGTQSEIFEFLAVVCLSGNFPTCYFQILESIRRDVGYAFLVASLSSKHGELPTNTLILVNGLLYGTDQTDIITKILSELEDAHFHNVFDVINKTNLDETWVKQAEIFKKIEEEHADSPELKVLKLMAEMKRQEDEIKLLRSKNIQLADDLENELCKQENYLTENETLKEKVYQKEEVINRLEEKIKSSYEIPAVPKTGKQTRLPEDGSDDEDSFFSPMDRIRNRGFSNPIKPKKVTKHGTVASVSSVPSVPSVASVNGLPPPSDIPPIPAPLDNPPPPMDDPPVPHIPPPMDNPPPPAYMPNSVSSGAVEIPPPMDTPPAPEPVNHSKNMPPVPFEMPVINLVETITTEVIPLSEIDIPPREDFIATEPASVEPKKIERVPIDIPAPPVNNMFGNGPSEMSLLSMSSFDSDMPCLPVIPPLPILPPNFTSQPSFTSPTMAGLTPRNTVIPPPSSVDQGKRLSIPGNSGVISPSVPVSSELTTKRLSIPGNSGVICPVSVSSDVPPRRPSTPCNSGVIISPSAPVSSDVPTKRPSIPGNSGVISPPCPLPADASIKRLSIPGNSGVVVCPTGPVSSDLPTKRKSMPDNSGVIIPTGPVSSDLPTRRSLPPGSSSVVSTHSTVLPTSNSGVIPAPPASFVSPPPPPPPGGKRLSIPGQNGVLSPPLPASADQGLPPKKTLKPSKKMRGFMWVKLPAKSIHGSIWKELDDEKHTLNFTEIEDLFGVDEDKKSSALSKTDQEVAPRLTVSLLENQRANNIEIMLRGLKMNHIEIKNALFSMVDTEFTVEKLKAIQSNIPTQEEVSLIDSYDGDKSELANAEKYFMAISRIPMLCLRVSSLTYKTSFETKSKDLNKSLSTLLHAIKLITSDKRFHKLLEIILALGNYLNANTNRGQTYGFKLNSLAKIGDVRSPKNPSISLLNYLADLVFLNTETSLLPLIRDFTSVHEAARESTTELSSQVNQLNEGLNPIKLHLQSEECDENFKNAMGSWVPTAEKIVQDMVKQNEDLNSGLLSLLTFFGESSTMKSEDFFGTISSFIMSLEQAHLCNEKRRMENTAREKRTTRKPRALPPIPAERAAADFDSLLNRLKTGQSFIERKNSMIRVEGKTSPDPQ